MQFKKYQTWIVRIGIILAIVAALVVALRLSMQSHWLRNQVVESLKTSVANLTGARLEIGLHQGDLYSSIRLQNVYLIADDTLLHAENIRMDYSIWPAFRKSIFVDRLQIDGLLVHLEKDSLGTFNVESLFRQPEDSVASSLNWNVVIQDIYLDRGTVTYRSNGVAADQDMTIHDVSASGSYRLMEPSWYANLRSLQFKAKYGLLAHQFDVSMAGNADDASVRVEHLLVAYGKTLANVMGNYATNSDSLSMDFDIEPLASDDVNAIIDPVLAQNIDVDISVKGTMGNLGLTASIVDGNRSIVNATATIEKRASGFGLSYVSATSPGFQIGNYVLVTDSNNAAFRDGSAIFSGWIPLAHPEEVEGDAQIQASEFAFMTFRLGTVQSNLSHRNGQTIANVNVSTGNNTLVANFTTSDVVSDTAHWTTDITANISNLQQMDLGQSVPVSFKGQMNGSGIGFTPGELIGRFDSSISDIVFDGQTVDRIEMVGHINNQLSIDSLVVVMGDGRLTASGTTTLDFDLPVYDAEIVLKGFDLSHFKGLDELKTDLNMTILASGIGYETSNRTINLELEAENSWVNWAMINDFDASIVFVRNRLFFERATLASEIADGQFQGNFEIDDVFRPSNNMNFSLNVKNLQPLASFMGVDQLRATGEIQGRVDEGLVAPELVAIIALDEIVYDSITVKRVVGQYLMSVQSEPRYQLELEFLSPNYLGSELNDIRFMSRGTISENGILGQVGFDLNTQAESGISVVGTFSSESDTLKISTSTLDIRGPVRTYHQDKEFNMNFVDGILQSDTLVLLAEPDAQLMVRIRHQSVDSTSVWFNALNVNLEALQTGFMREPVVAGYMTGKMAFTYANDRLLLETEVDLNDVQWMSTSIGHVRMEAKTTHQKLVGYVGVHQDGRSLVSTTFDVPFKLGDPNEFSDQFYEQPVAASLRIDSLDLTYYRMLFQHLGLPEIAGIVEGTSTLSGTAGNPMLDGMAELSNGSMGGIPVDHLELGWIYSQSKQQLLCTATMEATGQQVFSSTFNLPFNLDMRNFAQIIPESSDPVAGSLVAKGFNLALISQFLPAAYVDQLTGGVDGRVDLDGTVGQPVLEGSMRLRNAGVHIAPVNVALQNMGARVVFARDRITIDSVTVTSGSGTFRANGHVLMRGFDPGEIAFDVKASRFMVSDTRDVKAVVSFDGALSGTLQRPDLTGSMMVNNANIFLDNFGERTVEDVQLESETSLETPSVYDSLGIRLRVQVDPNVWMRNRTSPELAIELLGDMDLLKDRGSDLMAFGILRSRQGYAMQYGKRFQLERGELAFNGDPTNPELDIVSLYELKVPEDIEIRYLIGGTVAEPAFDFSSNPEMELENIISYTLFGKPFGALFTWQQSFSGGGGGSALARDAAIGVLVDRVESIATESLGIDVLQIDSNRRGETVTTSVKAGKYITDKLFVAVLNELGGSDAVTRIVLEYYIRRNLLFMVTQGNDRRSGVDILWKYEY